MNQTSSTENEIEDDNEVIELTGCGTITHWRLPIGITKCPVRICEKQFKTRSDLVFHYKEYHAKRAVYCIYCKKPIMSQGVSLFKKHHLRVHPNETFPLDFNDQNPTQFLKVQQFIYLIEANLYILNRLDSQR